MVRHVLCRFGSTAMQRIAQRKSKVSRASSGVGSSAEALDSASSNSAREGWLFSHVLPVTWRQSAPPQTRDSAEWRSYGAGWRTGWAEVNIERHDTPVVRSHHVS
jgi:hypothetical protein